MIRPTAIARRLRPDVRVHALPLEDPVAPVHEASMRALEFVIATAAIVVAIVLGFLH